MLERRGAATTISAVSGVGLLVWRLAGALRRGPVLYPDTTDYLAVEGNLVERWAADRPMGLPLLLDAVPSSAWLFVLHAFVGAVVWAFLLYALVSATRTRAARAVVTVMVLWAATSVRVVMWDAIVLTESLSISLLVLAVALAVQWVRTSSRGTAAALILATTAWATLRDTNAVEVALAAGACLGAVLVTRVVRGTFDGQLTAVGTTTLVVAGLLLAGSSAGHRGDFPFYNVMGQRILVDDVATEYFADHGMPVSDALLALANGWGFSGFVDDPDLEVFRTWAREDGRRVYATFLLTRPGWTAAHLGPDLVHVFAPLGGYGGQHDPHPLRQVAVPDTPLATATWTGLAGILLAVPRQGDRLRPFALLLVVLGAVDAGATWAADAMELSRHALNSTLFVGLGVLLQAGPVADRLADWGDE